MQISSRFPALLAVGAALALGACGGSDVSPVASPTALTSDGGWVTSSGNGPGGPPSTAPGTGTCTNDCDGTGKGPGKGNGRGSGNGSCGEACWGPVGTDPADILTILGAALQEEYKAQMLYRSVLEDYPGAVPFGTIVESEGRHVAALQLLFARRQQAPPDSIWTPESFPAFASIQAACAGGVVAETEDAAFYAPYLERTDLPQDARNVLGNLRAASLENHLPAFERCQ